MIFPFRPASSYFYTRSYPKGREMMHLATSIINSVTQTKIWDLALLFPFHLSSPHPVARYYWCCSLCSFCICFLLSFSTPLCSFNYHLKYCCNFLKGSPFLKPGFSSHHQMLLFLRIMGEKIYGHICITQRCNHWFKGCCSWRMISVYSLKISDSGLSFRLSTWNVKAAGQA